MAICGNRAAIREAYDSVDAPVNRGRYRQDVKAQSPFLTAAGVALCAVALTGVAFAQEATPKPDAMSADHMSSDHMSGMMKKPGMKYKAKHNMMKGDAMSKDHMAPDEPKQ